MLHFGLKSRVVFCGNALLSILIVIVLYVLLWRQRGGNLIAYFLMHFFGVDRETANMIYFYYFRSYREVFFAAAITFVFAFFAPAPIPMDDQILQGDRSGN